MSQEITFTIDGVAVKGTKGQTILQAAEEAGIYIPRLCNLKGLIPHGSCRVCTVLANGRPQSACIQPIAQDMIVENNTPELTKIRRNLVDMLFVEGNHFCMFCEKSGNCELQAMAYRLGILAPKYPFQFPSRDVDASHPDIFIDRNRCILCGRCVRASRDQDGKGCFEFVGRGSHKRIAVNAESPVVRHEYGCPRQSRRGLSGRLDPQETRGLCRSRRPAEIRPSTHRVRHRGPSKLR